MLRRFGGRSMRRCAASLVAVGCLVSALWRAAVRDPLPEDFDFDERRTHRVAHVVDGDTFRIEGGWRVRLIGIDSPELQPEPEPFAEEARAFVERRVADRRVRLIFDRERRDRFGRLLAFVEVDGASLNVEIVEAGLAVVVPRFSYSPSMRRRLVEGQQLAREGGHGLWSDPEFDPRQ